MPWLIEKKGNGFVLLNQQTGAQKGPVFPNEQKARAYQSALYANDPAARTEAKKIEASGHGGQELFKKNPAPAQQQMPMNPQQMQAMAKADAIKRRNSRTHGQAQPPKR